MAGVAKPDLYNEVLAQTVKRMEALNKLRTQKKNSSVDFLPSRAYAMFGHGREGSDTLIVPKNMIVIVKSLPGRYVDYANVRKLLNKLFKPEKAAIFENPLCYMPEIINTFGSVMVYKPGDVCPDFFYYLRPTNSELKLDDGNAFWKGVGTEITLPLNHYGIINIRDLQSLHDEIQPKKFSTDIKLKEFLDTFYGKSIYPDTNEILEYLPGPNNDSKEFYDTVSLYDALNIMKRRNDDLFTVGEIEQSFLAKEYHFTDKYEGVYYNFICRSDRSTELVNEWNPNLFNYSIKPTITSILKANLPVEAMNILKRRIIEAEQRKHLLKGSKFNTTAKARRRKNRRTRKARK